MILIIGFAYSFVMAKASSDAAAICGECRNAARIAASLRSPQWRDSVSSFQFSGPMRWRTTSNSITAAAAETLSDSM